MSTESASIPMLPWTGERMVPHASDVATELYHWQRYLYFRPWYRGAKVVDAASGEGYGSSYASVFAEWAKGYDISAEATDHANNRYPAAKYITADVCETDYSDADLLVSFETIEHVPDPSKFLQALATCTGRIAISTPNRKTHSPGNKLEDKPLNPYHTIEWTPYEFAELIQQHFPGRQVRFLSQQFAWPGNIVEGLDDEAMYCIAVIGDGDLPKWPKIGLSIPTHNGAHFVNDAVHTLSRVYPGTMEFAVVANGCDAQNIQKLHEVQQDVPHLMHLIEVSQNEGFAAGCNRGLDHLTRIGGFDYYGVVNDDVLPSTDCVCELVSAMQKLEEENLRPGVVGPVSNAVNGQQLVDIGKFKDYPGMAYLAEQYHRNHHSTVTQVVQLRGLFMLIHPECLQAVGGFDTRFGIGNFEDDDYNLRTKLAGFSTWIAEGAFLYHHGSSTFKKLNVDYNAIIHQNAAKMAAKWQLNNIETWPHVCSIPEGVDLFVPFSENPAPRKFEIVINGEKKDLVGEATEMEFAAWVMNAIREKPPLYREAVINVLNAKISA